MVTREEPVLWKPLILTSIICLVGVFVLLPINRQWSLILLFGILGVWTRVPGYYIPQIKELQTIDFFALMIALSYGPLQGAIFALVVFLWSRLYGPQEYITVAPKLGLTTAFSCFLAYLFYPVITNFEALLTFLIIFEFGFFLLITFIFERGEMAIEMYYCIILLPISYLHRLTASLFGADYLFELMAHEHGNMIWIYIFGIGLIAGLLGLYWVNQKHDLRKRFSFGGLFGERREVALKALVERTGFDFGEAKDLLYAVIVLGVILSAGQWGMETFNFGEGMVNLLIAINVVFFSYILHQAAYKWYAKQYAAYGKYRFYGPIAIFALLVGIVSEGKVIIPVLGTVFLTTPFFFRPGHKIEDVTAPFLGPKERAKIMAIGPLVSVFLALMAKALMAKFGESTLLVDLFRFNMWLALVSLLPLAFPVQAKYRTIQEKFMPPFPGAVILHGFKSLYVFLLVFVFAALTLINFISFGLSIFVAFVIAFVLWAEFFRRYKASVR